MISVRQTKERMLHALLRRRKLLVECILALLKRWDTKSYANIFKLMKVSYVHPRFRIRLKPKFKKRKIPYTNAGVLNLWPPYYTCGMSEEMFHEVYNKVKDQLVEISRKSKKHYPSKFLLLITLAYLKHYNRLEKLSFDFRLSVSTCSKIVYKVLLVLACSDVIYMLPNVVAVTLFSLGSGPKDTQNLRLYRLFPSPDQQDLGRTGALVS
jgi:hypothetical protein